MRQPEADPTTRFTERVEAYVRHRPGYPDRVIDVLRERTQLTPDATIADVGSGTGIATELFLRHGHRVYAVEPNAAMRQAAETRLADQPGFHSVAGTAEATSLAADSVDYVVAAQAFHWFDPASAQREFARILRADGWAVLMWNTRRTTGSDLLRGYEALLREHGTDYQQVQHTRIDRATLERFFAGGRFETRSLYNEQLLDRAGLRGRVVSSSFVPAAGEPGYEPMLRAVDRLFEAHQQGGRVRLEYDTEVHFGQVTQAGQ